MKEEIKKTTITDGKFIELVRKAPYFRESMTAYGNIPITPEDVATQIGQGDYCTALRYAAKLGCTSLEVRDAFLERVGSTTVDVVLPAVTTLTVEELAGYLEGSESVQRRVHGTTKDGVARLVRAGRYADAAVLASEMGYVGADGDLIREGFVGHLDTEAAFELMSDQPTFEPFTLGERDVAFIEQLALTDSAAEPPDEQVPEYQNHGTWRLK
ncbi:hypothetical protein ACFLQN_03405 [Candidatus Aenigmatarchaeota archaeon]